MFKPRSPFQPPVVQKVDKNRKAMMSVQQQIRQPSQTKKIECNKNKTMKNGPTGTFDPQRTVQLATQYQMRFAFDVQQPTQDDQAIYWQMNLSNQVSNEYLRKLIFRQQQYFIRGVEQSAIVSSFQISVDGLPAYYGSNGVQTNIACVLQLSSVNSLVDDIGLKTYQLVYKQTQDVAWDIPMNLSALKMRIYADGIPLSGNLAVPFSLLFDIRHVGK